MAFSWRKKDGDLFTLHINFSIWEKLLRGKYDVIICAGHNSVTALLALTYARIFSIPFIHWSEQTLPAEPPRGLLGTISRGLMKKIFLRFSNAHIASSTFTKDFLIANGVDTRTIVLSPYTTDISFYSTEADRYRQQKDIFKKQLGITADKVVLYVGQLIKRKGVQELLQAYSLLEEELKKNTAVVLIGDGPQEKLLKEYCVQEKLSNEKLPRRCPKN